jgi:hypothetical protein
VSARFVLHRHSGYGDTHFDLMLEQKSALATWQFAQDPAGGDFSRPLPCRRLGDHRREYLDYEGPVSRGRGAVERVDAGDLELLTAQEALWRFRLAGPRLRGLFELHLIDSNHQDWSLVRLGD